ncbi:hypothetical protein HKX48_001241 [Thoreauomyces humboldtii]|nr:hypothetical protein HKX48_001241 [Thoreauomyces humboldtii]
MSDGSEAPSENGRYAVQVVCDSTAQRLHVGVDRKVDFHIANCSDKERTSELLVAVVGGLFAEEQSTFRKLRDAESSASNNDWDNMRTMKYARKYQLTFSLLNADPSDQLVRWNIQQAINAYVLPFLGTLWDISKFDVHTQVQHHATLPVVPDVGHVNGDVVHILAPKVLPRFIDSAQWNLASVVSTAPPINFIIYVPSLSVRPLYLVKDNGELTRSNAFLMPRWGGVAISNPPATNSSYYFDVAELHPFMEIFISQLRDLLGVKAVRIPNASLLMPGIEVTYEHATRTGITLWEHDRLVRWRTIQNIADAAVTLNSLATLIERLESMVVLNIIQTQVLDALSSLHKAHATLQDTGKHVGNHTLASLHARAAITASESAFFDPTMVAMLYFPDEHKYAVYMPLFVPVAVPVIIAILKELKYWRAKRKARRAALDVKKKAD